MECEMCGKTVGVRRYDVSGTTMNLGVCCSRYGTPLDAPAAPAASRKPVASKNTQKVQPKRSNVFKEEVFELAEDFGKRIRLARERKKLSHEQLGNRVSARVPQLKQLESGHLRPSDDLARRIERELGITLLEKVETGPGAGLSTLEGIPTRGMTLGDLIKKQLQDQKDK